jgi:hypothetical protein
MRHHRRAVAERQLLPRVRRCSMNGFELAPFLVPVALVVVGLLILKGKK